MTIYSVLKTPSQGVGRIGHGLLKGDPPALRRTIMGVMTALQYTRLRFLEGCRRRTAFSISLPPSVQPVYHIEIASEAKTLSSTQ